MLTVLQIFAYWIPCLQQCNQLGELPSSPELQEKNLIFTRKLWPAPWQTQEFLILQSVLSVSNEQSVCWVKHLHEPYDNMNKLVGIVKPQKVNFM